MRPAGILRCTRATRRGPAAPGQHLAALGLTAACHAHLRRDTFADFTVLDASPLSTDPEHLTGLRVLATIVGGTPVYQSAGLFPSGSLSSA